MGHGDKSLVNVHFWVIIANMKTFSYSFLIWSYFTFSNVKAFRFKVPIFNHLFLFYLSLPLLSFSILANDFFLWSPFSSCLFCIRKVTPWDCYSYSVQTWPIIWCLGKLHQKLFDLRNVLQAIILPGSQWP